MLRLLGICSGPLFFFVSLHLNLSELSPQGHFVLGVTVWMALWWLFELVPLFLTSLLPMILFPIVSILPASKIGAAYGNEIIFLFFGGFLLSALLEKSYLHERFARGILSIFGGSPGKTLLGLMLATGFLSCWISNTAAVLLMLPLIHLVSSTTLRPFYFLGVGYAASLGGLGTVIGSPPNAIATAYLKTAHSIDLSFLDWMLFGIPFALVGTIICWAYIHLYARIKHRKAEAHFEPIQLPSPRSWSRDEFFVLAIFGFCFFSWIFRSVFDWKFVSDTGILLLGVFFAFLIPSSQRKEPL